MLNKPEGNYTKAYHNQITQTSNTEDIKKQQQRKRHITCTSSKTRTASELLLKRMGKQYIPKDNGPTSQSTQRKQPINLELYIQ